MGYDTKCYELAEAFLSDEGILNTTVNTERLAQVIQDAIEDEIADMQAKEIEPPDAADLGER